MVRGFPNKDGIITPVDFRENKKAPSTCIDFKGRVYLVNTADTKYYPQSDVEISGNGMNY